MIAECLAVTVRVTGDSCPLADASRTAGVPVEAEPPALRRDGNALLRFSALPDAGLAERLDADDRIRYLHRARGGRDTTGGGSDGHDEYRCLSVAPCVIHELTDRGFLAESLTYRDGEGRFFGTVVGRDVLQGVMAAAGEQVGVRLERVTPLGEAGGGGRWNLTPRQERAIRTAYRMGYFGVPKAVTASEVAAELGIGKTAFLERLRRGQATLFGQLLG